MKPDPMTDSEHQPAFNEFDPQVIAAMARWPGVPAVHGWLRLDRRGQWHLIDRGQPDFDEALNGAGSPITSPAILAFIARNYGSMPQGEWFWQNGPQRVFVDLDLAPRIIRVVGEGARLALIDHTGLVFDPVTAAAMSPAGDLWLRDARGWGAVHDLDLAALAIEALSDGGLILAWNDHRFQIEPVDDPPTQFAFEPRPRPLPAAVTRSTN
jgi:hypothetical protein